MDQYERQGWTKVGQYQCTPLSHNSPTFIPLTRSLYINSKPLPDQAIRQQFQQQNKDFAILHLIEAIQVLAANNWPGIKQGWSDLKETDAGTVILNFAPNIKEVIDTSMIVRGFDSLGMKARVWVNHKGTQMITFSGKRNLRKVLTGINYGLRNVKVVDLGIGRYGLNNSIVSGMRISFYFAAAVQTVNFILADEPSLAALIGGLAADVIKIGISALVVKAAGTVALHYTALVAAQLVIVLAAGVLVAGGLYYLDQKFSLSDKLIALVERAGQDVVTAARSMPSALVDLGAMFHHNMLEQAQQATKDQISRYLAPSLADIQPRAF